MRAINVAIGVALLCAVAAPATAQFMGIHAPTLERAELDALRDAAVKLYKDPGRELGSRETWEAPTGSHGTVALVERFEHDGMPCMKLAHDIKRRNVSDPLQFESQLCQTPEGAWKNLF